MRAMERTTRFKRDYQREKRSDPALDTRLLELIAMLAEDAELPERFRDHALTGEWKGFRDCHVRPDLVLIYGKTIEDVLTLVRIGSHSELFG